MPVRPATSYPGVYIQEVPSGVRTIVGVGTSISMFVGAAKRGPINQPVQCLNFKAFSDLYGEDASAGQLAQYVKLFFLNGGTECYVMRIAHGPAASSVTLRNEQNTADALILTAKDQGLDGENIRAIVTYGGTLPEATFNLELYAWALQSGQRVRTRREIWKNLSMDPSSSSFASTFLTQNSKIAVASLPAAQAPLIQGISQSGRPVPHDSTNLAFQAAWAALIGNTATARNKFLLNIDGSGFIPVDLNDPPLDVGAIPVATIRIDLATQISNRIKTQFQNQNIPGLTLTVAFVPGPSPSPTFPAAKETTLLQISSLTNGDVFIRPAGAGDLAVPLMLGSEQGGLEIAAHAPRRPAPSGVSLRTSDPTVWLALANLLQNAFTPVGNGITLDEFLPLPAIGTVPVLIHFNDLVTTTAADLFYRDNNAGSPNDNNDGLRDKLGRIAAAINNRAVNNPLFRWSAQVAGTRLTILPTEKVDDNFLSPTFNVTGFAAANFLNNVKTYTLGAGGFNIGARQVVNTTGSDGTSPWAVDYDAAYLVIDKEVDLFNLMVLPPVANANVQVEAVYGNASVFCQSRRAFLVMDRPATWTSPQTAISGLTALRTGLVKDYSAVFYPRITIDEGGLKQNVGPAGALAGLFARTDSTRGVWKAPAGTEADLRGIIGLEEKLSDGENGILNRRAINTLRIFPSGIVNWGARTNYGDDDTPHDYKYIPIRRLALFMEESLYRGLKWVVFEPNDEPLWSQIRLNVGSFMHDLFRQGAFQGSTPKDAYFVKCDGETTTQNDRNLGIVNIWVGYAPLKPAEFVILYLQQMAGQIET
jgi:phage tail sheath protein FI